MQGTMTGRAQQQARWLLWQMGSVTVDGGEMQQPAAEPTPLTAPPPEMRRSRYDAVIRRMQQAGQHTGTYTTWA